MKTLRAGLPGSALAAAGGLALSLAMAGIAGAQDSYYVDDDFAGTGVGDPVVFEFPDGSTTGATFGTDAFATIQEGVNAAEEGDTVFVAPGIYVEHVRIATADVTLRGPQASLAGYDESRVYTDEAELADNEAVIRPPYPIPFFAEDEAVVLITEAAEGVTLTGFVIEGSNPLLDDDEEVDPLAETGGVDVYAAVGLVALAGDLTITANILRNFGDDGSNPFGSNFALGMELAQPGFDGLPLSFVGGNLIENVDQEGPGGFAGILSRFEHQAAMQDNQVLRTRVGIQIQDHAEDIPGTDSVALQGNTVQASARGVWHNVIDGGPELVIAGNLIDSYIPSHGEQAFDGIRLETIRTGARSNATGNVISPRYAELGFTYGAQDSVGIRVTGAATTSTEIMVTNNSVTDAGIGILVNPAAAAEVMVGGAFVEEAIVGMRVTSANVELWSGEFLAANDGGTGLDLAGSGAVTLVDEADFAGETAISVAGTATLLLTDDSVARALPGSGDVLVADGATLTMEAATLEAGGDLTLEAGGTFDAGSGTVVLNGPSDATVTGFFGTGQFNVLALAKDAETPTPVITAGSDLAARTIVFGTGVLDNSAGQEVLLTERVPDSANGADTAWGVRVPGGSGPEYSGNPAGFAESHVIGPLSRHVGEDEGAAGGAYYLFPVGDSNGLAPFRFDLPESQDGSATGTMTVSTTGGAPHPNAGGDPPALDRFWTIETVGFSMAGPGGVVLRSQGHRFFFGDGDKPAGFDDAAEDGYAAAWYDAGSAGWTDGGPPEPGALFAKNSAPAFSHAQLGTSPDASNLVMPAGGGSPVTLEFTIFAVEGTSTTVGDWWVLE